MPPKAVSRSKAVKKKGVLKKPGPAVPPLSTQDPTNKKATSGTYRNKDREQVVNFNTKLEEKRKEHDIQVQRTKGTIKYLRKDNERLLRKQNMKFGTSLDMVKEIKSSLTSVKATNVKLYREMGETKDLHDRLEVELKEVKHKFSDTIELINRFKKDSKVWAVTTEKLMKSEARCNNLVQTNKRLKDLLLKNHINPNTDARELMHEEQEDRESVKSDKTFPKNPKKKMTVKGRYGSTDDLGAIIGLNKDKYDYKEGYGFLNNAVFQMSPAYLGFYKAKKQAKHEKMHNIDTFRPGVNLPRIVVQRGVKPSKYF